MSSAAQESDLGDLLLRRGRRLRHLVLVLSLGVILGIAAFALPHEFPPRPTGLGDDFRVFYSAALMLRHGANPYHLAALQATEQVVDHYPSFQPALTTFVDPPVLGWLMVPLTLLPYWAAYALLTAIGVVLVGITLTLLARDLGWGHNAVLAGAAVCCWIGLLGFLAGQPDALLFAALAGSMLLAWHERGLGAGLVLGTTLIKPDLLWPVPIFMLLALWPDRRRALNFAAGYLVVALGFAAASLPLLHAWWERLVGFGSQVGSNQPDLAGLPGLLGAAPHSWGLGRGPTAGPALAVVAVALVGMAAFGLWMTLASDWRRVSPVGRVAWGVALPLGLWLAATPYAHPNDDLLLLPLFMLTVGRDARRVHGAGLGLSVVVLALLLLVWPGAVVPWPVGVAVAGALVVAVWVRRTDARLTGFGAGLCLLGLVTLPVVWDFHLLAVGLTPIAVLALVVEGSRTCWMEVGGAGTGPAYFEEPPSAGLAPLPSGG